MLPASAPTVVARRRFVAPLAPFVVSAICTALPLVAAEPAAPSYNRDVRPILSDKCFRCHGPDAAGRRADLRLDVREQALAEREGRRAIVAGRPEASELLRRITTADADERMPPADSGLSLSAAEIDVLRRWIAAGAEYQPHWSLLPPQAAPLPKVGRSDWPRNEIDYFVLARLEREGLEPSPEADPAALCRRLYLDLTGLPPTPEEVEEFVRKCSPSPSLPLSRSSQPERESASAGEREKAYEALVDKLLASPRFGERMAVDWLDAARYADTNGYFSDLERQAWRWRQWVIDAYDRNLPFDRFTIEQLAGDLLPAPTLEQRIATGFHRNHMVTNESGVIDEEYRTEYVADRVDTTGTVWLGLTVGCARCHDHKYDPLTQREYYQLFAFFNNVPETGLVSKADPPPVIDVPTPAQGAELTKLSATRAAAEAKFAPSAKRLEADAAAWETTARAELSPLPAGDDVVLHYDFEDRLTNAAVRSGRREGEAPAEPFTSADSARREPRPPGNDSRAVGSPLRTPSSEPSFDAADDVPPAYDVGPVGRAAKFDGMQYVYAPAAVPLEADRPWTVAVWIKAESSLGGVLAKTEPTERRRGLEIIWQKGRLQVNLVNDWGSRAVETITRDPVAAASEWHQAIVSYDGSSRAAGLRVFLDGRPAPLTIERDTLSGPITNDAPLWIGRRDAGLGFYGRLDELRILRRATDAETAQAWYESELLGGILGTPREKRTARQREQLLDEYVERHAPAEVRRAYRDLADAREAEQRFRAEVPKTLVMQELDTPRTTHMLVRGQYDQPGEAVSADVPRSLPPLPADAPRNRLGLARWLVSPEHPLTARVAVNRLWQQCFGEGLVRTINDFGSQGEPPTHAELLDWLAVRFIKGASSELGARSAERNASAPSSEFRAPSSPWDVKALLKLLVTSATYRQATAATPLLLARDPENRLLARASRRRWPAEVIRDSALAASGLLVERLGGPSVRPYQPPGLWEAVSYNGEQSYEPDTGEGLWRRSLYTYWKRQCPPPALLTFDGPTRETCVVRRARTNTPLQALVLLNDETYVEAARALATLVLEQDGTTIDARLRGAFRRVTSRPPDAQELAVLTRLLARQLARFKSDVESARKLIAVGRSPRGRDRDPIELAAWTVVCQTLLNLDETVTRP